MMNDSLPNNVSPMPAAIGPNPNHPAEGSINQLEEMAAELTKSSNDPVPARPTVEVIGTPEPQNGPASISGIEIISPAQSQASAEQPRQIRINCSVELASNLNAQPVDSQPTLDQQAVEQPVSETSHPIDLTASLPRAVPAATMVAPATPNSQPSGSTPAGFGPSRPGQSQVANDTDSLHEFELAINGLTDLTGTTAEPVEPIPVVEDPPPAQLDLASNEPVYDVRDFADAQGIPDLLPNSFTVDPDAFEYDPPTIQQIIKVDHDVLIASSGMGTAPPPDQVPIPRYEPQTELAVEVRTEESTDSTVSVSTESAEWPTASEAELAEATESAVTESAVTEDPLADHEELFLADDGQVIELNGSDGYQTIDLQYFDVACAKFSPNQILVDDGQGTSFRILYRDIPKALFANGCEIML